MEKYSSSEDFMNEFVAKTRQRFKAMEYYKKAEGIPEVPIENLEKSGRLYEMWSRAIIGNMVEDWVTRPENKDKYSEYKKVSHKLFSAEAVSDEKERKALWCEYKQARYGIFKEMPKNMDDVHKHFEKTAERNIVWHYVTENREKCAKEFEEYTSFGKEQNNQEKDDWIHSFYERIPADEKSKIRKEYFSNLMHMWQANIKMRCEDKNVGIGSRNEGYCLRAITDILHTMTDGKGVLGELTAENMSPEAFVTQLKENKSMQNFVYRCCGEKSFENLVEQGVQPGALVFTVNGRGKAGHTMFWDGTINEQGEAELFGFNSEDKNIKASKKANEESRDIWVIDVAGIMKHEFDNNPEFEHLAKREESSKAFDNQLFAQMQRNKIPNTM